jgi:hypothetical protein
LKTARANLAGFEVRQIISFRWTILFLKASSTMPATFESQPGSITPVLRSSQQIQSFWR